MINDDVTQTFFAVMVNGKEKSRFNEKTLADNALTQLTEAEKATATVVPITGEGKQLLFG